MHFLLNLEKFKIYIKIDLNIAPTCFGLRPSSGSLYSAWLVSSKTDQYISHTTLKLVPILQQQRQVAVTVWQVPDTLNTVVVLLMLGGDTTRNMYRSFPEINKLCNVPYSWKYTKITCSFMLLTAQNFEPPMITFKWTLSRGQLQDEYH